MDDLFERARAYFVEHPEIECAWRDQAKAAIMSAVLHNNCTTITVEEANGDAETFWDAYLAAKVPPEQTQGEDN